MVASGFPLAYLTKSIVIPSLFVTFALAWNVVKVTSQTDFFQFRDLEPTRRRSVVLQAVMLQHHEENKSKVDNLDKLSELLDEQIKSLKL